jgi:hypothetical protein
MTDMPPGVTAARSIHLVGLVLLSVIGGCSPKDPAHPESAYPEAPGASQEQGAELAEPSPSATAPAAPATTAPEGVVRRLLRIHLAPDAEGAEVFLMHGEKRVRVPVLPVAITFTEVDPGYELVATKPGRAEYHFAVKFGPAEVRKDLYITFDGP